MFGAASRAVNVTAAAAGSGGAAIGMSVNANIFSRESGVDITGGKDYALKARNGLMVQSSGDDTTVMISAALSEGFRAGGTIVSATGGYSKNSKQILYFIVNHFQINKLKTIVQAIDENAFISLQDVSDIIKRGTES